MPSPPPQSQTIPLLCELQCSGIAQIGRRAPLQLPSTVESNKRVVEVQLVHDLASSQAQDLAAVETYLPGAERIIGAGVGAKSDGKRSQSWQPGHPVRRIVLCRISDSSPVFEGPCDLRDVKLTATAKGGGQVVIKLRLRDVDPANLEQLGQIMGQSVAYQLVAESVGGALTDGPVEGGLPFGTGIVRGPAGEIGIGDLVVATTSAGDEVVGLVQLLTEQTITLHTSFEGDPVTVEVQSVAASHPLCGPRGGDPGPALDKLTEEGTPGELATPATLLQALTDLQSSEQLERHANGWPVTDALIERVHEIIEEGSELPAIPRAGIDPLDDLPEEI